MKLKLPLIERAYRWIDILTHFDWSNDVSEEAMFLVTQRLPKNKIYLPYTLAAAAVYAGVKNCGYEFTKQDFERMNNIIKGYMEKRKRHKGIKFNILIQRVKELKWLKSNQE